jgi:hypothetical protein
MFYVTKYTVATGSDFVQCNQVFKKNQLSEMKLATLSNPKKKQYSWSH